MIHFPLPLLLPVTAYGERESRPGWGGFLQLNFHRSLLRIGLAFARLAKQGGDEVDYFLVRKHEFQGAERPFQYSFHNG